MSVLSFQRKFLDDLLSKRKQHTTRLETTRFKEGDIVHIYIEQRKRIIDKPVRQMTGIGTTAMADRVCSTKFNYPVDCPVAVASKYNDIPSYYAHFIGKVEIAEVYSILPYMMLESNLLRWARQDGFKDVAAADRWFTLQYGGNWYYNNWTAIRWDDWTEVYFETLEGS